MIHQKCGLDLGKPQRVVQCMCQRVKVGGHGSDKSGGRKVLAEVCRLISARQVDKMGGYSSRPVPSSKPELFFFFLNIFIDFCL